MYLHHYRLIKKPFQISPSAKYLWLGEKHKEALAFLKYGILNNVGFVLLTGDIGTGKTTLINAVINELENYTLVATIFDPKPMQNQARYIIRASFSQERMSYAEEEGIVLYRSKGGKEQKAFDALDWLAAMCSDVPDKGEQMVRYYGYSSNVCRGKRIKENQDALLPCILKPEENSKSYRKSWARLLRKIYEVDPLVCTKCKGQMRINI